jgi:quinol monooxygenase YgiN
MAYLSAEAGANAGKECHSPRAKVDPRSAMSDEVELTLVTMTFDASDPERLLGVLAKYVVISRGQPGCRNIDLAASATKPGRYVVIQKWDSPASQQAHFDSSDMVDMAQACVGLLASPPQIDLLEGISVHDLA